MWETVRLGDVLNIQNGYAFDSKQFDEAGAIGLIRIRDLKNGKHTQTRYSGSYESKYVVRSGDLLIGMDGEFRCYEWKGEDALLNQRVCRLQNFHESVEKRFILYVIDDELKKVEAVTGFTTVKHLSSKILKELPIPLPPLAEQKRIVERLDKAFAEIDKALGYIDQEESKLSSFMQRCIDKYINVEKDGSKWLKLKDFCNIKHGFAFSGKSFEKSNDTSKPIVLTPGNFTTNGEVCFTKFNTRRLNNDYVGDFTLPENSLVVVMTDLSKKMPLLGRPAFILDRNVLHNQRIGLIKNDEKIVLNEYLYYFFLSTGYIQEIKISASGTMVRHTAPKRILETNISVPVSLDVQRNIVRKLSRLRAKIRDTSTIVRRKRAALLSFKAAILKQELTPSEAV